MNSTLLFSLFAQATPAAGPTPAPWMQYAPLLFIGIIFYFLLIRPQQKQRKEHQALITSLKTGDKVVTSSGFHGMIANVKEQTFIVKFAENVKFEIDKAAITGVEKSAEGDVAEK